MWDEPSSGIHRKSVGPESVRALLDFAFEYSASSLDQPTAQQLLEVAAETASHRVVDVCEHDRLVVGLLLIGNANVDDVQELVVLGARPSAHMETALQFMLDYAESVVVVEGYSRVECALTERLTPFEHAFSERGYRPVRSDVVMARGLPPTRVASTSNSWVDLDEGNVPAAYECVRAAFAHVDGAQTVSPSDFARIMLAAPLRPRVRIMDGGEVAAFSRVVWKDESECIGEIRMICRHPRYPGMGAEALSEGMRILRDAGARRVCLEVSATNQAALALYRRAGFVRVRETKIYRLDL